LILVVFNDFAGVVGWCLQMVMGILGKLLEIWWKSKKDGKDPSENCWRLDGGTQRKWPGVPSENRRGPDGNQGKVAVVPSPTKKHQKPPKPHKTTKTIKNHQNLMVRGAPGVPYQKPPKPPKPSKTTNNRPNHKNQQKQRKAY
jgi:hypothetical protein